jgi:hypothetical protein
MLPATQGFVNASAASRHDMLTLIDFLRAEHPVAPSFFHPFADAPEYHIFMR